MDLDCCINWYFYRTPVRLWMFGCTIFVLTISISLHTNVSYLEEFLFVLIYCPTDFTSIFYTYLWRNDRNINEIATKMKFKFIPIIYWNNSLLRNYHGLWRRCKTDFSYIAFWLTVVHLNNMIKGYFCLFWTTSRPRNRKAKTIIFYSFHVLHTCVTSSPTVRMKILCLVD
jgi:hypothetical protein